MYTVLRTKLRERSAVVGVLGLGYVGLPLALSFARKFRVYGLDVRSEVVQSLREGNAHPHDLYNEDLKVALDSQFLPTTDFDRIRECDFLIIAVGTPLGEGRNPDLSQVEKAGEMVAARLRPGQFVVLESTSYPGTTEEVLVPLLERSGLRLGVDFGVAYSPERIDPGNRNYRLETIPKVVGGTDEASTSLAEALYAEIIRTVIPVSHARVAEAAKMIENLFRSVNIALVNEIALIMERLNIDAWEAIRAASTKPFGFMPFYPGPGVGGHCIPLDPFYLSYRAQKAGYLPRFIELSGEINEYMKFHTVQLIRRGLQEAGKRLGGSTVALLGLAFKKNVADTREAPSIVIAEECVREGARVRVFDPHASSISTSMGRLASELDIESALTEADAAVIVVDHDEFQHLDYDELTKLMAVPAVWIDTRGALAKAPQSSIALGIGRPRSRIPGGVKEMESVFHAEPQAARP